MRPQRAFKPKMSPAGPKQRGVRPWRGQAGQPVGVPRRAPDKDVQKRERRH